MVDSVSPPDGERLCDFRERIEARPHRERASASRRSRKRRRRAIDGKNWYVDAAARLFAIAAGSRSSSPRVVLLWIGDPRLAVGRPALDRHRPDRARRLRDRERRRALRRRRATCACGAGRTKAGRDEAERWDAFRRYLTDFPRLQEAPPATLELWERFLVYGIAFGIAERVLQGAQLHMPEEMHHASTIYWISPTGDLGSGPSALGIGDLSLRASAQRSRSALERLGRLRRRLLGRGRRRRWRWRRRGLVA